MVTNYAASQDRFNARREFHTRFYSDELKEQGLTGLIPAIQIELAINHCIAGDFTEKIVDEYVKGGLIKREGAEIESIN